MTPLPRDGDDPKSALENPVCPAMEVMLNEVRRGIEGSHPELIPTFDLYSGEARFGRRLIETNIRRLGKTARILEVGAGSLMLSCALKREGFDVTALEPTGSGFSHFTRLQEIMMEHARSHGSVPNLLRCPAEDLEISNHFDFAFSINVMEHVGSVSKVLETICRALKAGGVYRFVCPNYAFPYEPHFNLPTLFSRRLTEKFLGRRILRSKLISDPAGMWSSLNWITVAAVRRICRRHMQVQPVFRADIFELFLDRAVSDPEFQLRRGAVLTKFIITVQRLGIVKLARLIPVTLLPVMDCSITRLDVKGR